VAKEVFEVTDSQLSAQCTAGVYYESGTFESAEDFLMRRLMLAWEEYNDKGTSGAVRL
jgi:hypothetical protein